MRSSLAADTIRITPGVVTTLDVEVVNTAEVIDGLTALVLGFDSAWVQLREPVVTLFPEAAGTLSLQFDVPTSCPAGESALTVRVFSTVDPDRWVEHVVWVVVEPVVAAELEMRPSLVEGGNWAGMQAIVRNLGNVSCEFAMSALEPTRTLECRITPSTLVVEAGETAQVTLTAHGKRPWFGQRAEHSIDIVADSPTLTLTSLARFVQRPRIARGVLTAAILGVIITLWALIFLFAIEFVRGGVDPAKSVPESWPGAASVGLAEVAATVSGSVSASTTGEPLPRIVVSAYRETNAGKFELAGSAATGDDGTYSLGGLLPGNYRVQAAADGFAPVWHPGVPDEADAGVVVVAPAETAPGIDLVVTGGAGVLQGQLGLPAGAPGADRPATVTVSLVPASPDQEPIPDQQVTTTGAFEIGNLPTPATFLVKIEREGFETQLFEVELTGGEQLVLDTSSLLAANGSIAGRVVDGAGNPLGGVTVVIRSGSSERTITTPTVGSVGSFTVDELETPRTYVLTFTLDGYTSATVALDLSAAERRTGVTATLVGGAGSVQGLVRDAGGTPLGGVGVLIQGNGVRLQSSTLTTGAGVTGVGSYSFAGLPVPGSYTITFSKAGMQTTTVGVVFTAAGLRSGLDATLLAATATVSGTVTLGGVGDSGYKVVLSDGITSREVFTTSSPPGGFSFAGVGPGSYTVTVSKSGVATRIVQVEVAPGADLVVNVAVIPA